MFDPTVLTHNRDRLLAHEVAPSFFNRIDDIARRNRLTSDDHFSAKSALIEAMGSVKSFNPKNRPPATPAVTSTSKTRSARTPHTRT